MNIYTRVHHHKDTDESWRASNPVILDGEVILVDIDGKIRQKVGDGTTRYIDLPFSDDDILSAIGGITSIPIATPADAGKVLGIDENGNYALIDAPKGGGGTWGDLKTLTWQNLKDLSDE